MGNKESKSIGNNAQNVTMIDTNTTPPSAKIDKSKWIELHVSKSHFMHHFSCPVFLNSNEIIMATSNADSNSDSIQPDQDNDTTFGIYKYNINHTESKLFLAYTETQLKLIGTLPLMCYDKRNHKIFIFTQNTAAMIIIDIKHLTHKVIHTEYDDAYYMDGVVANGQFHVICRVNSLRPSLAHLKARTLHLQWVSEGNMFEEVHQFEEEINSFRPRPYLHYLKSRQALLAICNHGCLYMFDLHRRIWTTLGVRCKPRLNIGYAAIVTSDDRYLIIIKRHIQVIDLNTMDYMWSSIKGPGSNSYWFYATSYHDHRDELLISGYVKACASRASDVPMDIMDLIIRHYNTEWIYVFQQHDSLTPKWKILADEIILSCKRLTSC
eukprot:143863_1